MERLSPKPAKRGERANWWEMLSERKEAVNVQEIAG